MKMRARLVWLIAGCLGGSAVADIVLDDKGFESQTVNWTKVSDAHNAGTTGWDSNDASAQYRLGFLSHGGGTDALNNNNGGVFQNFTDTYVEGQTYSVSFWAYKDWGDAPTVWAYFTDASGSGSEGGTVKASSKTGTLIEDQWVEFSVSYTATAADIGDHVGFGLSGTTGLYVDDFSDITVIPEPATLGLVAVFGGAVLFVRRKFMI